MKNFRRFALIGAVFLAFLGFSSAQAHADTVIPDIVLSNQAGTEAPGVSAPMALLGCGLTGTATSAVNITDSAGVYFRLSGTAGARVQWSMGNAVWSNGILLTPGQNGFVNKWGTQIRFVFQGSGYGCVSYMLAPGAGSSGAPSVVTCPTCAQETTADATYNSLTTFAYVTAGQLSILDQENAQYIIPALTKLTSTAQGYVNRSITAVSLDAVTAYLMDLTVLAGTTNGPCRLAVYLPDSLGANLIRVRLAPTNFSSSSLSTTGRPVNVGTQPYTWDEREFTPSGMRLQMIVPAAALPTTATAQLSCDCWQW